MKNKSNKYTSKLNTDPAKAKAKKTIPVKR